MNRFLRFGRLLTHGAVALLGLWVTLIAAGCQSALVTAPPHRISSSTQADNREGSAIEVTAGQVFQRTEFFAQMNIPTKMRASTDIGLKYSFELSLSITKNDELTVEGESSIDGQHALLVRLNQGRGNMKILVSREGEILPKLVIGSEVAPYKLRVASGTNRLEPVDEDVLVAKETLTFLGAAGAELRFLVRVVNPAGTVMDELKVLSPRSEKIITIRGNRFEVQADRGTSLVLRILSVTQNTPKPRAKNQGVNL
jgi:hypothetical protein